MQHIASITHAHYLLQENTNNSLVNKFSNYSFQRVNILLSTYASLIDENYKGWFARLFYKLSDAEIHNAAEKAQRGESPKRYFAFLINLA